MNVITNFDYQVVHNGDKC